MEEIRDCLGRLACCGNAATGYVCPTTIRKWMTAPIEMLSEVKESIINAYEIKTGLSRAKLSHLMDAETWMNAHKATADDGRMGALVYLYKLR